MIVIAERLTDAIRLRRIKKLGVSDEEAREILAYDKEVENSKDSDRGLEYDLTDEQEKAAKKARGIGTRDSSKPVQRTKKENPTKSGIIAALTKFIKNELDFDISDVQVTNKEREILFRVNGEYYSIVLTYKTKMNK